MSFHDIRLSDNVERNAQGGPGFKTTIITLASGHEQRNADWQKARARYDISYGIDTKQTFEDVLNFFYARRGRLFGFRFKDWIDYEVQGGNIGTGDGTQTQFQLQKVYSDAGGSYVRHITRPVAGTTRLFLDGGETTAFSIDNATGVVTFDTAPGAAVAITADFEFDVPVRFNSDEQDVRLAWENAGAISGIELVELRERLVAI